MVLLAVFTLSQVWFLPANSSIVFCQGEDEGGHFHEEDDRMEVFSRRKLESNWDRYEESERPEPADDTPTQRGTDYHVLLESAGEEFVLRSTRVV